MLRLQAALKRLLSKKPEKLSNIAYESAYYDQAHFNRDFKTFTGTTPTTFTDDKNMALSVQIYRND